MQSASYNASSEKDGSLNLLLPKTRFIDANSRYVYDDMPAIIAMMTTATKTIMMMMMMRMTFVAKMTTMRTMMIMTMTAKSGDSC